MGSLFKKVAGLLGHFEEHFSTIASVANTFNSQNFIIFRLKDLKFYFATSSVECCSWQLCWPFVNFGIEIGNGIDITNAIISSFIKHMNPKLSRVVTQDKRSPHTKSCDTLILSSSDKLKNVILHAHKAYGPQT